MDQATQSQNISALTNALVNVQSKLQGAIKGSTNPFYKSDYADLESVWNCCRPLLTANGLCVIQTNGGTAEAPSVITTLAHTSGEWIRGELPLIPDKKGPQGIGSCITYGRRYSLAAIIGITQADDDAEGAMDRSKNKTPSKDTTEAGVDDMPLGANYISEKQRTRLHALSTKNEWVTSAVKSMLAKHGFESSKTVTNDKYKEICEELEHGMESENEEVEK